MQDIEGLTERAAHLKCEKCSRGLHFCPLCLATLSHREDTAGECWSCIEQGES